MISALTLSLGQLGDRRVLAVLLKTLALTFAIFAALGALLWFGAGALVGWWQGGAWASGIASALSVAVALLGGWLLFRAVAVAVLGLFAEEVVIAVEARHYPEALRLARAPSWPVAIRMALGSAARTIAVNLLLLPLYLVLLATGVGSALLFAAANAWLLGRDLGEMVAVRHMERAAVRPWLAATRGRRFTLGLAVTGLFVLPVVNLLAPVIGAAMATHMFHARWRA